jgi:endonuclease/exonuclease/phosphatase family metal-dependent hydrolase
MKKVIYIVLGTILGAIAIFLIASAVLEHRPAPLEEAIHYPPLASSDAAIPDTMKVMTWNIGYAGLGDNMTFFMDGGKDVRDSRERTQHNLDNIIATIRAQNPDIVLLQEVDVNSHRTYHINEVQALQEAFPEYHIYFASNLKSWFIPTPIREPIGEAHSGVVIMTKFKADLAIRHQYPAKHSWPARMFHLKKCLLETHFTLPDSRTLIVGNTHCSAYDDGSMRIQEIKHINNILSAQKGSSFIIGGDWNQYPKGYTPSDKELNDKNFIVQPLPSDELEKIGKFTYDPSLHTARYLDKAYDKEVSTRTLIDYFFHSEDIIIENISTLDMEFRHSDHNPVIATISLQK